MQATRLKAGIQDMCSDNEEDFAAYRDPTRNLGSPCQLQPNKPIDSNYYIELGILYHYLSSMYDIRNWTWNNRLVTNRKRGMSRLYIVTPPI